MTGLRSFCILIILQATVLFPLLAFAQDSEQIRGFGETWVATDGLGRTLPTFSEVGPPDTSKYVGIFYFLWQGSLGYGGYVDTAIYDNTKLLEANPENPAYGPHYATHWWGEPEAGYYRADDPWVIRRNLQMLADAGVDFVFFDASNGLTYLNVVFSLCDISEQMRQQGIPTPYITFLTHANSGQVVDQLYSEFYKRFPQYSNLWFFWDGKPLILGDISDPALSSSAKDFFTFRNSWAWMNENIPDQWQWIDYYPQHFAWHTNPRIPEQIPVAVASHPTLDIGESYHDGVEPPLNRYKVTQFTGEGLYFQEQWNRALQVSPEVVMVTGWNEWTAARFIAPEDGTPDFLGEPAIDAPDSTFFVDEYNMEFNRDIEPMMGGYTDNHYYQLVANIRRYKGCEPIPSANGMHSIKMDGDFASWDGVQPIFYDPKGDTQHRSWEDAVNKDTYINNTGRNDIIESRVAYDSSNIYFYVETAGPLTSWTSRNWMLLFINSDTSNATGWCGYDYLVNLNVISDSVSTLSSWNSKDSSWDQTNNLSYRYSGNQMEIRVPRALLGLTGPKITFYFHWADNIQKLNDISQFFLDGDSAPDRRFNYCFTTNQATPVISASQRPIGFHLSQNYPNPFNPTTEISYELPEASHVTLVVYDVLGREVETLVNHKQNSGTHHVAFDAGGLPSGVYFYKLIVSGDESPSENAFSETKKMMILK